MQTGNLLAHKQREQKWSFLTGKYLAPATSTIVFDPRRRTGLAKICEIATVILINLAAALDHVATSIIDLDEIQLVDDSGATCAMTRHKEQMPIQPNYAEISCAALRRMVHSWQIKWTQVL